LAAAEPADTGTSPGNAMAADEALLRAAGQGDRNAFGQFVERHHRSIVQFAYRFLNCRDRATAEDLAQDVFLKAWQATPTYKPQARATTWLFRIATNTCLNRKRADRLRRTIALPQAELPSHAQEAGENTVSEAELRVRRQITRLPEAQRAAVVLRHYHELPYADIAEILGTTVPSVESLLFRARKALRQALQKDLDFPQVSTRLRAESL
jgi:RNA polymerase sigma-70 factor (ECF subfamily)